MENLQAKSYTLGLKIMPDYGGKVHISDISETVARFPLSDGALDREHIETDETTIDDYLALDSLLEGLDNVPEDANVLVFDMSHIQGEVAQPLMKIVQDLSHIVKYLTGEQKRFDSVYVINAETPVANYINGQLGFLSNVYVNQDPEEGLARSLVNLYENKESEI